MKKLFNVKRGFLLGIIVGIVLYYVVSVLLNLIF